MRIVENILDKTLTPLRPKVFTFITGKDLHKDHDALEGRLKNVSTEFQKLESEHDTVESKFDSLSDEHSIILDRTQTLGKMHGVLKTQLIDFDKQIPGILDNIRKRIKEHSIYSDKISKLSETQDKIGNKLDFVRSYIRRHGCPCPVIKKNTRIITRDWTRGYSGGRTVRIVNSNNFRVRVPDCNPRTPERITLLSIPISYPHVRYQYPGGKTATCICTSVVEKGVEYSTKRSESILGGYKTSSYRKIEGPTFGMVLYDLESTIPRKFKTGRQVDARVYIDGAYRGTGSGTYVVPSGEHTITVKHPDYYPVSKKYRAYRKIYAWILAWLVKKRLKR